jgi:hypothetical protein
MYSEKEVLRIITSCKEYLSFGDEFNENNGLNNLKRNNNEYLHYTTTKRRNIRMVGKSF